MTKQDLRSGMIVECRDGRQALVLKEYERVLGKDWSLRFKGINYDLTSNAGEGYDIIKVYSGSAWILEDLFWNKGQLLWERKEEPKELTVSEIEELLGYPVKIVKE